MPRTSVSRVTGIARSRPTRRSSSPKPRTVSMSRLAIRRPGPSALHAALVAMVLAFISLPAAAQTITTQEHAFRVVRVAEGLEHPWGLAFLPDGRMLVTERPGRLRVVGRDGNLDPQAISGLPP